MIVLSPHDDDESLYCAYTLIRFRPLVVVVTDSWIQFNRGDPITWSQRRKETERAMEISKCPVEFLGIKDTELTEGNLTEALREYSGYEVYAPAIQGGNAQHDLVGKVAGTLFEKVKYYTTYTKTELWTTGTVEIKPSDSEIQQKNKMLDCYRSQLWLPATRPHFDAVRGKSEWLL